MFSALSTHRETAPAARVYVPRMHKKRPIDVALEKADALGWDQSDLARRIGESAATVTNWKRRGMAAHAHAKVAKALGISVDQLLGNAPPSQGGPSRTSGLRRNTHLDNGLTENGALPRGRVPLISFEQVESWGHEEVLHHDGPWFDVRESAPSKSSFSVRVEGSSMVAPEGAPVSFPEGTVITVDPEVKPAAGRFVLAKVGAARPTFKQLQRDGGRWYLVPLNDAFPTQEIDDPAERVIGVVIEYWRGGRLV